MKLTFGKNILRNYEKFEIDFNEEILFSNDYKIAEDALQRIR